MTTYAKPYEIPRVIDLIGASSETIELCVAMATIIFWNQALPKKAPVLPVVGFTYDRDTLQRVDLAVMMKELELSGASGKFALILPTGHRDMELGNWAPQVRCAFSDALVYQDGKHGDAILMAENHSDMHEARHIVVARALRIT